MRSIVGVLSLLLSSIAFPQTWYDSADQDQDSLVIRKIFDEALLRGESFENLHYLCKNIGHRLTGSAQLGEAVTWGQNVLSSYGPDKISLQHVDAPHWIRGDKEWVAISEDIDLPLQACALGGSIGTNGPLQAQVVEVNGVSDLKRFEPGELNGKIVFFNEVMDKSRINTFEAYGACISQRYVGAVEASKYGAVAVLVRSATTLTDEHPHTGSMSYKDGIKRIPAAAISTQDADVLHGYIRDLGTALVTMNLNCYSIEQPTQTYNVIAELKGAVDPEKIMVVGAHLDSWDKGEGAHDDGAGIVQCMEVLRIFKAIGYRPNYTLRIVLYVNEENGNRGGHTYAEKAREKREDHICAIETDRGGFSPRGFSIDAAQDQIARIASFEKILEAYGLHYFKRGYAGVDIGPLKLEDNKVNDRLILMGLYPDSQRYFDYHHSDDDVFENVNQRELELGGASIAAMVFLLDKYYMHINNID